MTYKVFRTQSNLREKICFVLSACSILISVYLYSRYPALLLYFFSVLLIVCLAVRVVAYWLDNYILFMLDMCYFINALSVMFVWAFPHSQKLQYVQFGLANAHAYCGTFLFRNAMVLHDLQKMISSFIHILPVMFSFLVRWFPRETSLYWYTQFVNSEGHPNLRTWHINVNWTWVMLVPLILFVFREVFYYLIIYGCIKPDEKYLDSYRYLHKKKYIKHLWSRLDSRWRLPVWVILNTLLSACVLFLAILAWSSYLFHCAMIVVQLLTVTWNGACYYLDIFPVEVHRQHEQLHPSVLAVNSHKTENCDSEVMASVESIGHLQFQNKMEPKILEGTFRAPMLPLTKVVSKVEPSSDAKH